MTTDGPATEHLVATGRLDLARGRFVRNDGESLALTTREVALLDHLAGRAGQDVSRDELLTEVFGHHELSLSRAVDTTVTRLRRKLELDPRAPEVLCTAHGHGYRLVLAGGAPAAGPVVQARPTLVVGDRSVDLATGLVQSEHGKARLTAQEIRLLDVLAARPGALVSPDRLARVARVDGGAAALPNAIWRLRSKLEDDPGNPRWLVGVRGAGYRLDAEPERVVPDVKALAGTLWTLARETSALASLDDCVVYVADGPHLVQVAAHGPKVSQPGVLAEPLVLRIGEGIVGTAARLRCVQDVPDVRADPRYVADTFPGRSELAVPIVHQDRLVGVIDSESPRAAAFGAAERTVVEAMARIASAAVADLGLRLAS